MKRQLGLLFVSRSIAGICQVCIFVLLARGLSAVDLGPVMIFLGIANFLVAICDAGVGTLLIRVRARDPSSSDIPAILRINVAGMFAAALLLALIGLTVFQNLLPPLFVALSTVWVVLERNSETWVAICVADRRNNLAAYVTLIRRVIPLAVMLPLGLLIERADTVFAVAQVIGGVLGVLVVRLGLKGAIPSVSAPLGYEGVLRRAFPYWMAVGSSQVREVEGATVGIFGGPVAAGAYSLAQRLSKPVQLFASSLSQVVLARAEDTRRGMRVMSGRLALATAVLALGGLAAVPVLSWIGPWVVGAQHSNAVLVLQVAVVAMAFVAMSSPFSSLLQANDDAGFVAGLSFWTAVSGLGLAAIGAWFGGAIGACVGTSVVYVAKFFTLYLRTRAL